MAAATTKGLFFIFILLGLVGIAKIWIEKEKLKEEFEKLKQMENKRENIKEEIQKTQQKLDSLEANYKMGMGQFSDAINEHLRLMDPVIALAKQASEKLPQDFTQLERFLQSLKGLMEMVKVFVDGTKMEKDKQIEKTQQKLREVKKTFELLEKKHSEL